MECWLCPDIYRVKSYENREWTWTCPKCKSKTVSNVE
jgi:Zn finger protein HypA/HybF involved in hydrogenase expression